MVYIDLEISKDNREPRIIVHCDFEHMIEAENIIIDLKKAMEAIENENKMS